MYAKGVRSNKPLSVGTEVDIQEDKVEQQGQTEGAKEQEIGHQPPYLQ